MARPIKPGIDYFSHDVTMSASEKIERLEHRWGNDGYAVYNKILEKIYASAGTFNLENESDFELYGAKWHTGTDNLKEIIAFMREINLFPQKNFISVSVKQRINRIQSERMRQRKRKQNNTDTANVFHADNHAVTAEEQCNNLHKVKESKEKEIKEKEIKEKEIKEKKRGREARPLSSFYLSLKDFCTGILDDPQYVSFDLKFYYEKVKTWANSTGALRLDWFATAKKFMLDDLQNGKPMRASYKYNMALISTPAEQEKEAV